MELSSWIPKLEVTTPARPSLPEVRAVDDAGLSISHLGLIDQRVEALQQENAIRSEQLRTDEGQLQKHEGRIAKLETMAWDQRAITLGDISGGYLFPRK